MTKNTRFKKPEDIPVWNKSYEATLLIYKLTKKFPKHELYGITSQLRRCASSIAANITEGFYRNTTKELINFLYISRGSCGETIFYLKLSTDLGYISKNDSIKLINEFNNIAKQLNGWINSLKRINH